MAWHAMTVRPAPLRHWRSDGDDPLPTGQEDIVKLMRHAGCGGRAGKDELISGIASAGPSVLRSR